MNPMIAMDNKQHFLESNSKQCQTDNERKNIHPKTLENCFKLKSNLEEQIQNIGKEQNSINLEKINLIKINILNLSIIFLENNDSVFNNLAFKNQDNLKQEKEKHYTQENLTQEILDATWINRLTENITQLDELIKDNMDIYNNN
jgi:hypothetical protein